MNKLIILFLSTMLVFSCKKVEEAIDEATQDKTMAEDNNIAESSSDDVSVMSDEAYNYGELKSRGGNGGFGMLVDSIKITFIKADSTIIIDFGSVTGVVCKDGKTRKGKIYCMFKNGFKTAGSSRKLFCQWKSNLRN
jgi:hypothetical protein